MVAATVAAQPKEIPMTQAKSKRKPASRASKTKTGNNVKRTTARKAVQLKPATKPAAHQRPRPTSQPTTRRTSKKAHGGETTVQLLPKDSSMDFYLNFSLTGRINAGREASDVNKCAIPA